ncbi:MAG: hypothetical protein A2542_03355 [Parcubacteria group bacterium RIFOXYD2_FULL_52_8]|nr:MAG: hypothetical protein A2542_03355 [Parcubacteria group bacterium RIFOXYD2_FULL_52_8]
MTKKQQLIRLYAWMKGSPEEISRAGEAGQLDRIATRLSKILERANTQGRRVSILRKQLRGVSIKTIQEVRRECHGFCGLVGLEKALEFSPMIWIDPFGRWVV